jgi:LysM repeat protein
VKRTYRSLNWLALLMLISVATLLLVACVRPVPGRDATATAPAPAVGTSVLVPTTDPLIPTVATQLTPTTSTIPLDGTAAVTPPADATAPVAPTATVMAPTAEAATAVPTTQPGVETTHVVQAGDNLFRIGLRYGCDDDLLAQYNGIPNKNVISVGQVIRIPANC